MKESIKDKLAMAWAMFGALTFGFIFMAGDSNNITGNVMKEIYHYTSTTWKVIYTLVLSMYLGVIIYAIWKRKIYKKRRNNNGTTNR